jgi:hypothetical protein
LIQGLIRPFQPCPPQTKERLIEECIDGSHGSIDRLMVIWCSVKQVGEMPTVSERMHRMAGIERERQARSIDGRKESVPFPYPVGKTDTVSSCKEGQIPYRVVRTDTVASWKDRYRLVSSWKESQP